MQYAFRGHVVVLINEETASDGEAFAEGARRLGIATIIGTRTWGGEIWLSVRAILLSICARTRARAGARIADIAQEASHLSRRSLSMSTRMGNAEHGCAALQADMFTLQAGGIASGGQSGVYSEDGKEWLIEGKHSGNARSSSCCLG